MIIKINPQPKPRMVHSDKWKKRPCVMRYWAYKDELRWAVLGSHMLNKNLPDAFTVLFVCVMPKSWSKKKKEEFNGRPHSSRPDVDNLLKGFMDALYEEDSGVWKVSAAKVWGYEGSITFIPEVIDEGPNESFLELFPEYEV